MKYSCLVQTPCAKTAKSCAFCDSLPVSCFTNALCQNCRIRLRRILRIVCRFTAFASGNSCFISSRVQKLQNSAKQNSGTVRRFFFLQPAVWGFGLGLLVRYGLLDAKAGFGGFGLRLLVSQSFLGAKAPLDPRTPFLFFATGGLGLWRFTLS